MAYPVRGQIRTQSTTGTAMAQLIRFCCLFLCFCLAAAVLKHEVYDTINRINNEVRSSEYLALENAIAETSAAATSPAQNACLARQSALARAELNVALGRELVLLRKEYGVLTQAQLDSLTSKDVEDAVRERLTVAVASSGDRNNQIRGCV